MTHLGGLSLAQALVRGWELYDRIQSGWLLRRLRPDGKYELAILELPQRKRV